MANSKSSFLLFCFSTFCFSTFWATTLIGQQASDAKKTTNANRKSEATGQLKSNPTEQQSIIVVQGAGGTKDFEQVFIETCQKIKAAAAKSNSDFAWIGDSQSEEKDDRAQFKVELEKRMAGTSQLWIILVGHGTYDQKYAKFNLRGPDLSAKDLNEWLEKSKRPIAIVNCASSSAPFINELAANGRVVVTATKSGFELNYARFGIHFADALTDPAADIDKDEQVSLLESFLFASRKVEEYYKAESRLSTEHALIDDNGDGKGTPLSFFRGVRVIKRTDDDSIPDGPKANQIHLIQSEFEKLISAEKKKLRSELELKLEQLRAKKDEFEEDEYYSALEQIALDLANLYQDIEEKASAKNDD